MKSSFAYCVALIAFASIPNTLIAQARDSSAERWAVDDLLLWQDARTFQLSPDGRRVAWIATGMSKTKGRMTSNLFVTPVTGGATIEMTRGDYTVSAVRWSPDGTRIAFLSSRPLPEKSGGSPHVASTQLWMFDAQGGEPWPVTTLDRTIDSFEWTGTNTMMFSLPVEPSAYEIAARARKDDSRVIDDSVNEAAVRLYSLDLRSLRVRQITDNADWIQDFAVSPDGKTVVSVHERSLSEGYDQHIPSITRLTNLSEGSSRVIFDGRRIIPSDITWARDGTGFYFTTDTTTSTRYRTATIAVLDFYDLASGKTIPVDHSWPRGVVGNLRATPDGIIATLGDGVFVRPARYTRKRGTNDWTRAFLTGARADHAFDMDVSADGRRIAYRYTRANLPPQLYGARLDGARIVADTQFTRLNPSLANKPQPRVEIVHWKGARGEEVEGILTYPLQYVEGQRSPLVLTIHGGPALADLDEWKQTWSYPRIPLNQKGAFTLQVNYHGSSRYGLAWVESICCGKIYDLETPDLERGIAFLAARGLVDSTRLGTLGHSYGAILSTQLTTIDQRFRAASAAAGDVEWFSDWGGVSFGASYDNYYFGASPWEDPELYVKKSPVFRLKDVRTPTIIYHGSEDRQVPPGQGWTYFRALQQLGQVPVRYVIFPGEPHSLRQYVHQRRKVDEDMEWFDRYLFNVTDGSKVNASAGPTGSLPRASEPR